MVFHKDGVMVKFTWVKGLVPEKLPVKQVYGIAFSDDNRVILMIDDAIELAKRQYFVF